MNKTKIFLALSILFLLPNAFAFTSLTHQYFSNKILKETDLNCYTAFLQGAIAPDNSIIQQTYPELTINTHYCLNNDLNCTARQKSIEFKQKSHYETDSCKKSYLLGISINLMQESYDPAQWANTEKNCANQFDQNIENAITNFTQNYDIKKECLTDQNNTIRLRFTQFDENNLVNSLRQFYTTTQPTIDQQALNQTAKDIISIITHNLDQNQNDIAITTQLLTELEAYSCLLSPIRKQQAYLDWQNLDQTAKNCLKDFSTGKGTQAYNFAAECPALNYSTGDLYTIYTAQNTLDQYFQHNFAQKQCRQILVPTITLAGTSPTQGMLTQQICEYVPTQSIKGCITEFENQKKREDQIWQNATTQTATVMTIIIIIIGVTIAIYWSSGS